MRYQVAQYGSIVNDDGRCVTNRRGRDVSYIVAREKIEMIYGNRSNKRGVITALW